MAFLGKWFGRRRGDTDVAPAAAASQPREDWLGRGNAALQAWNLGEAADCFRRALQQDPADARALLNFGFVLLEQGDAAGAQARLAGVPALLPAADPLRADAQFLRGRALRQLGQVDEALASFDAAATRPGFLEPLEEAVQLLLAQDRHAEALQRARRLHGAAGSDASALLLAQALCRQGEHAEALPLLEGILARQPNHAGAWSGRGEVLLELERPAEALEAFERALALAGESPEALTNAAAALGRAGRLAEGVQRLQDIVRRWPANHHAALNLTLLLLQALRPQDAVQAARRALEHHPQDADLHWVLAVGLLLQGDFAAGWVEHEWRWQAGPFRRTGERAPGRAPAWRGDEDLRGRTVLVFSEQGLGDTLQFLRYVPALAQRAGSVLLLLPPALHALVAGSGLPANCRLLASLQGAPAWDREVALLSLPLAFGTTAATIPAPVPYLRADPARVRRWRERLQAEGAAFNVGIVWSGNPRHANDRNRSASAAAFRPLAVPGCRLVALQPEMRDSDRAAVAEWGGLLDWGRELRDFADTAALVEALDLVVTVDTSVAHLAGALGKPVWILLAHVPDWRWMLGRTDSPWYPGARLFRQPAPGAWPPVLEEVRRALAALPALAPGAGAVEDAQAASAAPAAALPAADPARAEALITEGNALEDAGQLQAALARYRQAVQCAPGLPRAHLNLGIGLAAAGDRAGAEAAYAAGLALDAAHPFLRYNLGHLRYLQDDWAGASAEAALALAAKPDFFQAWVLQSNALDALGRHEEALAAIDRALALQPQQPGAHLNRVRLLTQLLRIDAAVAAAQEALRAFPADAELHWAAAIGHLLRGDFAAGWQEHEWRWLARGNEKAPDFGRPRWDGRADLQGRSILLFAEQGFGDTIQFLRFVPALAARAQRVVLRLPRGLLRLAGPALPANCTLCADGDPAPATELQFPLLSLPLVLGTDERTPPGPLPYLRAEGGRVAHWRERLRAAGPGPKVGLVWSGNPAHSNDRNRSIPLRALAPLAAAGCRFVSLQPQVRESDRAALQSFPGMLAWGTELGDFAETAALLEALDLVLTVDTSVAHLAGALARPTWILLPYVPDWRWQLARPDSPWYPSARLYRQDADRAWDGVLRRVQADLQLLAAG